MFISVIGSLENERNACIDDALDQLSADERARHARLVFSTDRRDCAFTFDASTFLKCHMADHTQAGAFTFGLFRVCIDYRLAVAVRDEAGRTRGVRVRSHDGRDAQPAGSGVVLRASSGIHKSSRNKVRLADELT